MNYLPAANFSVAMNLQVRIIEYCHHNLKPGTGCPESQLSGALGVEASDPNYQAACQWLITDGYIVVENGLIIFKQSIGRPLK